SFSVTGILAERSSLKKLRNMWFLLLMGRIGCLARGAKVLAGRGAVPGLRRVSVVLIDTGV
ncbi:MAG: hypothetical protein AAFV54_07230, partial [Pseudomonadota bacterium]